MSLPFMVFSLFALVYSIIIHEYMHGWMADRLGDPTARYAGRLTLNPIPHIDPVGSIFIPAMLVLFNAGFIIGWAKPVPFNPYNLKDKKYGALKVAIAGPVANFFIALSMGVLLRFLPNSLFANPTIAVFAQLISYVVWLNLLLVVFNLIPIPPLDGSKVLLTFLPYRFHQAFYQFERFGILILFLLLFVIFPVVIFPTLTFLFKLITGYSFFYFF